MSHKLLSLTFVASVAACSSSEVPLLESQAPVITLSGNPDCESQGLGDTELRIDPPEAGTHTYALDGGGSITVVVTSDGRILSFVSTIGVDGVIVKGGTLSNIYSYDPEAFSDSGLHAPTNASGNFAGISHYSICYDIVPCENVVCDAPAGACQEEGVCNPDTGLCEYAPKPGGTVCRPADGFCDLEEVCDGSSADCPADAFKPATTGCRASNGSCDVAEYCTGDSAECPDDGFDGISLCRPADGACDLPEYCDGSGVECPDDGFSSGNLCRGADGVCDTAEYCDGSGADCPADGFSSGNLCRAANGVCDSAEYCDGSGANCPADGFSSGNLCRAASGVCDTAEYCDGTGAQCPGNLFLADTTLCRGADGVCDNAEYCTGSGADCPADGFKSSTVTCRASAGVCDVTESCTGSTADCPSDGFSSGNLCRAAAGDCDVAEYCSGDAAACPGDGKEPSTQLCRGSAGDCDVAEYCDGTGDTCPSDGFAPATKLCRDQAGECDVAEYCTGGAAACPGDGLLSGNVCRPAADDCDLIEVCSGSAAECPPDSGGACVICGQKFYDANANGAYDPDESGISGWKVYASATGDMVSTFTDEGGTFEIGGLPSGDYTVCEVNALESSWKQTAPAEVCFEVTLPSAEADTCELDFGNLCLGAGGGKTPGFWSNRNGQWSFMGTDGGASSLALLVSLNLRNADGTAFNPTSYAQFKSWLLGATASANMAYKLSSHLAAMALNVKTGYVAGTSLVYAPGATGANTLGFISVNALIAEANAELGLHGLTPASSAYRAYQEALKNALDKANNNLNFVQDGPCAFSFPSDGTGADKPLEVSPGTLDGVHQLMTR